jgi:type IV pilus assembly protein PilA
MKIKDKLKINKTLRQAQGERGFTLVELLVVIAIIAILSVVSLASFTRAQVKARDVQRKSDLIAMSKSLMMYYNDYGVFPALTSGQLFGNKDVGFTGPNGQIYMRVTPEDPKKDELSDYVYEVSPSRTSFNLFADLENKDDSQCIKEIEGSDVGKWNREGNDYCYGVSSPNTVVGTLLP